MATFWEEIAHDESRTAAERLAALFDVVDANAGERPLVAIGALREILALTPEHARAQTLYDGLAGAQPTQVRKGPRPAERPDTSVEIDVDIPDLADWWVEEAEFFIAQGLWTEAGEALREASVARPGDPRLTEWLAYVEAERTAA